MLDWNSHHPLFICTCNVLDYSTHPSLPKIVNQLSTTSFSTYFWESPTYRDWSEAQRYSTGTGEVFYRKGSTRKPAQLSRVEKPGISLHQIWSSNRGRLKKTLLCMVWFEKVVNRMLSYYGTREKSAWGFEVKYFLVCCTRFLSCFCIQILLHVPIFF